MIALAVVTSTLLTLAQFTEPYCAPRKLVLTQLLKVYRERPIGIGLEKRGQVVELFSSKHGDWTLVSTSPSGISCVMASGEGWQVTPYNVRGPAL